LLFKTIRFACLSQEKIINDDEDTHQHTHKLPRTNSTTHIHGVRRKRFARDPDNETNQAESLNASKQPQNVRERKPPPIYLTSKVKDYIQFSKILKDSIGDNFYLKYLGDQIKIQFFKTKNFTDFKKYAIDMNFTFHTYSLPDEKSITVTLKGLPNISNLLIQEELKNHGITVNSCSPLNKENSLYATYKINLSAKYTLAQLRKIRYLHSPAKKAVH